MPLDLLRDSWRVLLKMSVYESLDRTILNRAVMKLVVGDGMAKYVASASDG